MELENKKSIYGLHGAAYGTGSTSMEPKRASFNVVQHDDSVEPFDISRIYKTLTWASSGYESSVSIDLMIQEAIRNMYDGIMVSEVTDALILSAVAFIEKDPAYGFVAAQLVSKKLFYEVAGESIERCDLQEQYEQSFVTGIQKCITQDLLDRRMEEFDLPYLARHLIPER